jgi:hypothetical protein
MFSHSDHKPLPGCESGRVVESVILDGEILTYNTSDQAIEHFGYVQVCVATLKMQSSHSGKVGGEFDFSFQFKMYLRMSPNFFISCSGSGYMNDVYTPVHPLLQ